MRPKGEIHQELLKAVGELATAERGATLREAAFRACVGLSAARYTMKYLRSSGSVVIARTRRVPYRNRPVAEYALAPVGPDAGSATAGGVSGVGVLLAAWGAPVACRSTVDNFSS
jgi:hypothetical protein